MKRRAWPAAIAVAASIAIVAGCAADRDVPTFDVAVPPPVGAPLPAFDIDAPGRTADLLGDWAAPRAEQLGISATALESYGYAAAVLSASTPGCGIGWTTLAGIGYIESRHGTYGGSSVQADGTVRPPIRGVPLDGGSGNAEIADTDGGQMDGDPVYDRAMGPMQFIPETWRQWGVDANGDGVADPDNLDDAALTAARYLCSRGGDLTTAEGWQNALMAYNLSGVYLNDVATRASRYAS